MRKFLFIIGLFSVLMTLAVLGAKQRAPIAALVKKAGRLEKTKNKEALSWQEKFQKHSVEIWSKDGKVFTSGDGHFWAKGPSGEQATTFVLNPGDEFYAVPDHHASATFRLKEIQADGAVIEYESRFDHRSFGKNLISVDKGKFKAVWK